MSATEPAYSLDLPSGLVRAAVSSESSAGAYMTMHGACGIVLVHEEYRWCG
jgi:hypothetical protein